MNQTWAIQHAEAQISFIKLNTAHHFDGDPVKDTAGFPALPDIGGNIVLNVFSTGCFAALDIS